MSVTGGFDPGTFQAWALNLFADIFTSSGVARGLVVTPTSPAGMAVLVGVDATQLDGVCYLPNGAFMRIDAPLTLTVTPNGTGSTRTDAVVAFVDPTGATAPTLSLQANWSSGFSAAGNQLVLALVSVASGALSITSGNITNTSQQAKLVGAGGSSTLAASDGLAFIAVDDVASGSLILQLTGLTTGQGRAVKIQTTDASAIGHQFLFDQGGNLTIPGQFSGAQLNTPKVSFDHVALNGEPADSVQLLAQKPSSGVGNVDVRIINPTRGYVYMQMQSGTSYFDSYSTLYGNVNGNVTGSLNGNVTGNVTGNVVGQVSYNSRNYALLDSSGGGNPGSRVWVGTTQPVGAQEGDIWIKA